MSNTGCPDCGHTPHGLAERCPFEEWDIARRCPCTYRRGDDLPSGSAVRRTGGRRGNPGPWHIALARQDGYAGRRTVALCGVNVWTYSDYGYEYADADDELEGKRCRKCIRAASRDEPAAPDAVSSP